MNEGNPQTVEPGVRQLSPEFRFALDTLKKVIVFVVIALSAVGIHKIVEVLEEYHYPAYIIYALLALEVLILITDVVWFVKTLFVEILQILRPLVELFRQGLFYRVLAALLLFLLGVILSPYLS